MNHKIKETKDTITYPISLSNQINRRKVTAFWPTKKNKALTPYCFSKIDVNTFTGEITKHDVSRKRSH